MTTIVMQTQLYSSFDDNIINLATQQSNWVIDSGASVHATSKRNFLHATFCDFGNVRKGNEKSIKPGTKWKLTKTHRVRM